MRSRRALVSVLIAVASAASAACTAPPGRSPDPSAASPAARLTEADVELVAELLQAADTRRADTTLVDRGLTAASPFVRAFAARTVGQIGITARATTVRRLVADPDSMIAADASFSLGLLHDTGSVAVLTTALAGPPTLVAAAAWSLGELGDRGRQPLEEVLRSGQPSGALADVLQAVTKLRPVPAALVTPYLSHPNGSVRRSAVYAVTRSRVPAATSALIALAQRLTARAEPGAGDDDVAVDLRSYLARGLSKPGAGDPLSLGAIGALRRLVDDPHPHVRINAIRSLATFGPEARGDLVRHLRDADANARIALAQSLGGVVAPTSGDWEEAWRADTGFTYRRALLSTAVRSGARPPAIDPSREQSWQRHPDWRYRAAAAEAAGAGSSADIDGIVIPLLHDPDPRVRNAAYGAVASWADSASAASKPYGRVALRAAVTDSDLFVRSTVLDALRARARVADAWVAWTAWRRAARDPESDARLSALRVLAAAWKSDSASFSTLRDSLAALTPPSDPLERDAGRAIGMLQRWPRGGSEPKPAAWYLERVRSYVARDLAGRAPRATITTIRGSIQLVLRGADAPLTVANFADLANRGYYNGLSFHRIVPNFVAQDGDPRGDGSGGPGFAIRDELNRRWYDRGAVGMALSGADTGGSQYFLTHSPQPHLDGHYTVFAHVTAGLDVLDALVQGDRILRITIE